MSDDSDLRGLSIDELAVYTDAGLEIVAEITLRVYPGRVLALVGESGCGKTTIGLAALGYARDGTHIRSGSVLVDGARVVGARDAELRRLRGNRISYVPQDPGLSLNPRRRVGEQVAEAMRVHEVASGDASRRTAEVLSRMDLPTDRAFLRRYPFELSGGQQQRVVIAMALALQPSVVVLDEPTTGLDVSTQARILKRISELASEGAVGFMYVTHDLAVVDMIADDLAVIYAGRVVESGPLEQTFSSPVHPYTALLLQSVPRLRTRRKLTGILGIAPAPGARPGGCSFAPRCPVAIEQCRQVAPAMELLSATRTFRCYRPGAFRLTTQGLPSTLAPAETSRPDSLLVVDGLDASYGAHGRHQVLKKVSVDIAASECVALVGESGSGKTTLGRCLVGLHCPDGGRITLDGELLAPRASERSQPQRQMIQIVFQNPEASLNPSESVENAIKRPLRLFGTNKVSPALDRQVAELLDQVRLPLAKRERYPRELSGGEKQRVAIARALAARPRLLVCDEVTSALDVSTQAAVVALLQDLMLTGLSMLFITHNLALVNSIADRVVVLLDGVVCEEGHAEQVISAPSHLYTQDLIRAAPEITHGVAI